MLKLGCLIQNTVVAEKAKDFVKLIALEMAENGYQPSLSSVYNIIRKSGIEIDLESVGYIYNEVLPRDDATFDSEQEIEDATLQTFANAVYNLVQPIDDMVKEGEIQIGKDAPERAVAIHIANSLYNELIDDKRTKSEQKTLQEALWRGIQRLLKKEVKKPSSKKDMADIINQALSWEKRGIVDLNGKLNTINELFYAMQDELAKITKIVEEKADPYVQQRWNEYIKILAASSYNLLFTSSEARQVRNEALKKAGFSKTLKNGVTILDYNKLAANIGDVSQLRANAIHVFETMGYDSLTAQRIADSLANEFYELRTEIISKQLSNPERFASEGFRDIQVQSGLNALIGNKTLAEWISEQNVETLEQLHKIATSILSQKKYHPIVISKILQKINDFYDKNYAKVDTEEARRVIEDLGIYAPSGKATINRQRQPQSTNKITVLEWIKNNGIQNVDELRRVLDNQLANRNISDENKNKIKSEFERIFNANQRAEKELQSREKRMNIERKPPKTAIKKLVELYHLGIFESSHLGVLYNLVGLDELQIQDLKDLEDLAKAASAFIRKVAKPISEGGYGLGSEIFVGRELQRLQREMNRIIQKNIHNKTKITKIVYAFRVYTDMLLTALLGGVNTLLQNILSGVRAVLAGLRRSDFTSFFGNSKQAFDIYFSMLSDVTKTGLSFGEEIGSFTSRELFTNSLRWKWGKDATISDKAKSLLYALYLPLRIGTLAFDSANKVALYNKILNNMIYKALRANGMTNDEALRHINENLYGQKFEEAKQLAKKILEDNNSILPDKFKVKITNSAITTLANDIVKSNLLTGQILNEKIIEILMKSAYHVAGVGLGHEANNFLSAQIHAFRKQMKNEEEYYAKNKDWAGLSWSAFKNTFINFAFIRFTGGATNWLVWTVKEGFGLGILTGLFEKSISTKVDFSDEYELKKSIQRHERANQDIARGMVGLAFTGIVWALGFPLIGSKGGGDDDDEKEIKRLEDAIKNKNTQWLNKGDKELAIEKLNELKKKNSVYRRIKENTYNDRLFRSLAPPLHILKYYIDNSEDEDVVMGLFKYTLRTFDSGRNFTFSKKIEDAMNAYRSGDKEAAKASIASYIGQSFGIPLIKQYGEYYTLITNPFRENPIPVKKYIPPTNFEDAILGGGALETLGIWKSDPSITVIPKIGYKTYEKFKSLGVSKMSDLKDKPYWYMATDPQTGKYILTKEQMKSAKEFTEEYFNMKKEENNIENKENK